MAVQHGLHVLAAAAVTAACPHGAVVVHPRTTQQRTRRQCRPRPLAPDSTAPAGSGAGHERVVSLHAAFLDLTGNQTLKTADAHLDRYWASIAPLYPRSDIGRTQS